MDYKRMLFCVLDHPVDAETHNILPVYLINNSDKELQIDM
jgi:hypothetical protein